MAAKTYKLKINKSDGTYVETASFTIPDTAGTYSLTLTLSNGSTINAGNIVVGTEAKTYQLTLTLSDGSTINAGTFTTPAVTGWKTIWTGSRGVNAIKVKTGSFSDGSGMYSGSATIQHEIVSNAYPTRITYTLAQESPQTSDLTQSSEYLTIGNNSSVRARINSSSNNIDFVTTIKGNQPNTKAFYTGKAVTLTKVEQYY